MTNSDDVPVGGASAGVFAVVGAATLWALIGVFTRELGARGVAPLDVAWWRAAGGGLCFAVHAIVGRVPIGLHRSQLPLMGAFTIVGVSIFYLALPEAVGAGGITVAFVLLYTAPVWVAIGARVALGETIGRVGWCAVATVVIGVMMVVGGQAATSRVSGTALGWGLAAGLSYASYYLVGRRLFASLGAVATYAVALPIGALPLGFASGWSAPTISTAGWAVGLVVISTYLPYLLIAAGLKRLKSSTAVVLATTEPVIAAGIGWSVYGERLGWIGASGAMLVVVAAVWAATSTRVSRRRPREHGGPRGRPIQV